MNDELLAFPPEHEGVDVILTRCTEACRLLERVALDVATDTTFDTGNTKAPRNHSERLTLKRDGRRLDVRGEIRFLDKIQHQSNRFRLVIDDKVSIRYTTPLNETAPPRDGLASLTRTSEFARFTQNPATGLVLDGVTADTEGQLASEFLASSGVARLRGRESVGGVDCAVVEGAAPGHGFLTLWIATGRGYHIQKMVYAKSASDWFDGRKLGEQPPFHHWPKNVTRESWVLTLDKVQVARIGAAYVPISGEFVTCTTLSDGRVDTETLSITRSNIELDPAFQEGADFVTDFPEGGRLWDGDAPKSEVPYAWVGGELVPELTADPGPAAS